ncbi:PQQ-binding-like beta-propeller repeat protein, partial [Streptomyces boncukensis]
PGPYGPYGATGQQQPPMYPAPGAPGGGGGKNNKMIAIVAAAVAAVLVAGAGVFFLTRDDDGDDKKDESKGNNSQGSQGSQRGGADPKPTSTKGDELFSIDDPEVKDYTKVPGAWATDKVFAKTGLKELLVVDLKTNQQKKPVKLRGEVCGASNGMTKRHEVGLVVRETVSSKASCNHMVVVNIETGKIVMDEKMPNAERESSNENVAISGDTVASAWTGGSAAYDIPSGKELWSAKPSNCRDEGYAGGKHLYAVTRCGTDYDKPQYTVQRLDPKNKGKATWKFKVPKGVKSINIASTDPLVLAVGTSSRSSSVSDLMTVGEDKALKARIPLDKKYVSPCYYQGVDSCYNIAVGPDTVYLATKEHSGQADYGRTNEIMALDFNSGNAKWKAEAGEKRSFIPLRMQGTNLIAYKLPDYQGGGEVVSIEPGKGKQTRLLQLPASRQGSGEQAFNISSSSLRMPLLWEHNRLFLHKANLLKKRDSGYTSPFSKLAAGFGAE